MSKKLTFMGLEPKEKITGPKFCECLLSFCKDLVLDQNIKEFGAGDVHEYVQKFIITLCDGSNGIIDMTDTKSEIEEFRKKDKQNAS